jgi:hypothetical protein
MTARSLQSAIDRVSAGRRAATMSRAQTAILWYVDRSCHARRIVASKTVSKDYDGTDGAHSLAGDAPLAAPHVVRCGVSREDGRAAAAGCDSRRGRGKGLGWKVGMEGPRERDGSAKS